MSETQPLPSRQECFELLEIYRTPKHVIQHILGVNKVAVYLAKQLRRLNISVNLKLVDRAALLHDLLRVCDFSDLDPQKFPEKPAEEDLKFWMELRDRYKQIGHEQAAFLLFKDTYPELAEVIRKHRYSIILSEHFQSWEEKLVYYADKRVKHDTIVSLKDRFEDGHKRYPHASLESCKEAERIDAAVFELEKEIFKPLAVLGITPSDIQLLQPKPTKLVIFDFDGVIEDSFSLTCEVYKQYQEHFNTPYFTEPHEFRELFETDWRITLRRMGISSPEDIAKAEGMFRLHMKKHKDRILIYPGIKQVIETLHTKYKLAIVSNNHCEIMLPKLQQAGLDQYFDLILDCMHCKIKPEIDQVKTCFEHFHVLPGETIMIGDMDGDIITARRAGLKSAIAVTYGYHPKHRLEDADIIVDEPLQLLDVIQ